MNLSEISFPVFKLRKQRPEVEDGAVYYEGVNQEGEPYQSLVDDTRLPQETLGRRRLMLALQEKPLAKLSAAIYFLGDLIKVGTAGVWFIDNSGKLFEYKKQRVAKLTFHKIERLIPISSGGLIVLVMGIPTRFKTLFNPPAFNFKYAGILELSSKAFILYGLYEEKPEDTWRKY
jgi:hypothetical protein